MRSTSNQKYEITDIAHESYPFLHRIRARKDIGSQVKAGDLGGFVEGESNLSSEPGDDAWLFDDAIAAGGPTWIRVPACGETQSPVTAPMCPVDPSSPGMPVWRITPICGER